MGVLLIKLIVVSYHKDGILLLSNAFRDASILSSALLTKPGVQSSVHVSAPMCRIAPLEAIGIDRLASASFRPIPTRRSATEPPCSYTLTFIILYQHNNSACFDDILVIKENMISIQSAEYKRGNVDRSQAIFQEYILLYSYNSFFSKRSDELLPEDKLHEPS
jgi:hypothetical protein